MSVLTIYDEQGTTLSCTENCEEITATLATIGVDFERWQAATPIEKGMEPEAIMAAYRADIDRLKTSGGYQTVDVISLQSDHPEKDAFRQKFLNEHTHSEDEVRFFVAGGGMFYLHVADKVYALHCVKDDLLSVPAGVTHWFDMGPNPEFTAIRLFTDPAGWVANFTGSDIATRIPYFE
ncbi:MAG: 1,2-dihydroxy-3-keto-5-methylthiopentene dioxygenase [Pontibacterium sp.]